MAGLCFALWQVSAFRETAMREVILSYWNWFADLANHYSTIIIAGFTVVLALVAWRQMRDARILQRAYLNVRFGGIENNSAEQLIGHVTFQNVGHLPARKLHWLVKLNRGGGDWQPPKIKNKELLRESVIPVGAEWPQGSNAMGNEDGPNLDETGLYLYVWGRVTYKDGFRWRKRYADFCHSYPWQMRKTPISGGVRINTEYGRYHRYGNRAT
jgi:hypothetical protein